MKILLNPVLITQKDLTQRLKNWIWIVNLDLNFESLIDKKEKD